MPSTDLKASAPRTIAFTVLNSPAHPCRYRRFACPLTGANARLAEKRGSVTPSFRGTCTPYLLPVRLAHQIHDLRNLPAEVVERYGFRYPALRRLPAPARPTPDLYADETSAPPNSNTKAEATAETTAEVRPGAADAPAQSRLDRILAAERHRRLGEDSEIGALQAALVAAPGRLASYMNLALAYGEQGAHRAAWEALDLAADNRSPWALLDLPLDAAPRAGTSEAAPAATGALVGRLLPTSLPPEAARARIWLRGTLAMAATEFTSAARVFADAGARDPDSALWRYSAGLAALGLRHYEAAIGHLEAALDLAPEHQGAAVALATVHLKQDRPAAARAALEAAARLDAEEPVTHYLLGRTYLLQGDPGRAAVSLGVSVRAAPGFLDAWLSLAKAYRAKGSTLAAIEAYREVIRRRPDHAEAHLQLAKLFKRQGDNLTFRLRGAAESAPRPGLSAHDWRTHLEVLDREAATFRQRALQEFTLALKLRPSDGEALRQVAEIYRRSAKLREADEIFAWLAERRPEQWIYPYRLGTVRIELGQLDRAMAALRRAIELAPQQGDPYLALGLAQVRTGRLADAIETFRLAMLYAPFNPALHANLGAAHAARGDYGPALRALGRSLELATFPLPRRHLTHTNLALVHLRQGRRAEALHALKSALHVYPGYDTARLLLAALRADDAATIDRAQFLFNDHLEIFGEVTTVAFGND